MSEASPIKDKGDPSSTISHECYTITNSAHSTTLLLRNMGEEKLSARFPYRFGQRMQSY